MSDQPLVQISSPIRQGDYPQVVVRVDSPDDVGIAEGTLNEITHRLAPLVKSTAQALADVPPDTATAVANLAQAGVNPQVVPPPAQAMPVQAVSQCPACSKSTACTQCGQPTEHTVKWSANKGQNYNQHQCNRHGQRPVITWCKTPIPKELVPVLKNPNLVYSA